MPISLCYAHYKNMEFIWINYERGKMKGARHMQLVPLCITSLIIINDLGI